ncbi:calcineurin-like phosphoesterase C-terminal domain-containing protein [Lysobacter sp. A6]|uniref:Calcineurin-like phosphoesterase C-terminal domain-containing protein n=1 Tax=Noviluteimonas lactosilytica TaxID=2888523 RepID=A0ABS8JEB9_9GAMM|nr:calcineurin-like phosphoesterase C-terminal domain-containing protein [Lysobacter lactosilyticus]MCC8361949.1 calcineurin-like phosphoesterase C-terminal domain-containing protein [Lysobacter lactosilyticus]
MRARWCAALLVAAAAFSPLHAEEGATGAQRFLVIGDPQPKSTADVDYFLRDIIEPAMPLAKQSAAAIVLGDIVDDEPALYPGVKAATKRLGIPMLFAPGNHDVDAGAQSDADSLRSFRKAFGDDTFLRKYDNANVLVLDDVVVLPGQTPGYVGGLREDQFAKIQRWLKDLPRDKLLVVGAHIPFFDTSTVQGKESFRAVDRERLFALLQPFPHVLLLSAHTHNQRHYFHGEKESWKGAAPLHEYNVGAACGAFWSGVADAAGIPDATMSDGTPNGYATLDVQRDGTYALAWYPARDAAGTQIALHAPKVLRRDAYPAFGVYANVFMGHAGTRVEYRIDDGDWMPMRRVVEPDPRLLAENARDDAADTLRGFDRSPEATPSTHLWRGTLPTKLAAGEHTVEVRAFDEWRGEATAKTTYRLEAR